MNISMKEKFQNDEMAQIALFSFVYCFPLLINLVWRDGHLHIVKCLNNERKKSHNCSRTNRCKQKFQRADLFCLRLLLSLLINWLLVERLDTSKMWAKCKSGKNFSSISFPSPMLYTLLWYFTYGTGSLNMIHLLRIPAKQIPIRKSKNLKHFSEYRCSQHWDRQAKTSIYSSIIFFSLFSTP